MDQGPFEGSHHKDCCIFGCILGSSSFWVLPFELCCRGLVLEYVFTGLVSLSIPMFSLQQNMETQKGPYKDCWSYRHGLPGLQCLVGGGKGFVGLGFGVGVVFRLWGLGYGWVQDLGDVRFCIDTIL